MILEDETKDAYGYYPSEVKQQSSKTILAACDDCGKVRITSKHHYHPRCSSCANKGENNPYFGNVHTEGEKATMSTANKGEKNPMFGKTGERHPKWKGGRKLAATKSRFMRRNLGSAFLMPLEEGEIGHHVTNEFVIGIPVEVHVKFGGYTRKTHRARILEWLKDNDTHKYNLVVPVLKNEKESIK